MARRLGLVVGLAGALVACSPAPPSPGPSAAAIATPSPHEAEAIAFRTSVGLPADVPYVRAVAANPFASSVAYSVPLLPIEIALLNARPEYGDAIETVILEYADLHPSDFGGLYVDTKNGGAVTTLWTAHLDDHVAAIRRRVRPGSLIAFRLVTYTARDLRDLQDRISADWSWMRAFAIAPTGVSVDVVANHVEVDISSTNPNAASLITAHYGVPAGMIDVFSDWTGAALIPPGNVLGNVVDSRGEAPGALFGELSLEWASDGPGTCGSGDVGYGISRLGRFDLPCQAGGHTVTVLIANGHGEWVPIASGHVVAIAGATVSLTIRLDRPWSAVLASVVP